MDTESRRVRTGQEERRRAALSVRQQLETLKLCLGKIMSQQRAYGSEADQHGVTPWWLSSTHYLIRKKWQMKSSSDNWKSLTFADPGHS